MNKVLSIGILTNGSFELVKNRINELMNIIKSYNITLIISDNKYCDENNLHIIKINKKNQIKIEYISNDIDKTINGNFNNILNYINSKYFWVIGDSISFDSSQFFLINKLLNSDKYDFICLNSKNKSRRSLKKDIVSSDYIYICKKLLWHITLLGSTIFKSEVLQNYSKNGYKNFPQIGAFLEYSSKNEFSLYFLSLNVLATDSNKKQSYWFNNLISTFAVDWVNALIPFKDNFNQKDFYTILKSHSYHTKILGLRNLILFISKGYLDYNPKELDYLLLATHSSKKLVNFIFKLPRGLLKNIYEILYYFKKIFTYPF